MKKRLLSVLLSGALLGTLFLGGGWIGGDTNPE